MNDVESVPAMMARSTLFLQTCGTQGIACLRVSNDSKHQHQGLVGKREFCRGSTGANQESSKMFTSASELRMDCNGRTVVRAVVEFRLLEMSRDVERGKGEDIYRRNFMSLGILSICFWHAKRTRASGPRGRTPNGLALLSIPVRSSISMISPKFRYSSANWCNHLLSSHQWPCKVMRYAKG